MSCLSCCSDVSAKHFLGGAWHEWRGGDGEGGIQAFAKSQLPKTKSKCILVLLSKISAELYVVNNIKQTRSENAEKMDQQYISVS